MSAVTRLSDTRIHFEMNQFIGDDAMARLFLSGGSGCDITAHRQLRQLALQLRLARRQNAHGSQDSAMPAILLSHLDPDLPVEKNLALMAENCQTLVQEAGSGAVLLYPITGSASSLLLSELYSERLPKLFPQLRFAQVFSQASCRSSVRENKKEIFADFIHTKLIYHIQSLHAVLPSAQIAYLLKGWQRPQIAAYGLKSHPASGQLKHWSIESILKFCRACETAPVALRHPGAEGPVNAREPGSALN